MNKDFFLEKYNIDKNEFDESNLEWDKLIEIYEDYSSSKEELEQAAIFIFNSLMKALNVHSVRYRIKDPEHLIEKIIRKKLVNSTLEITLENYREKITDLIGLRALHLFKDDWSIINSFITEKWELHEKPIANYRKGDSEDLIKYLEENGCERKEHPHGYRSVHYIIKTQPAKRMIYAEIQVRTIFEEAWSEIDHTVRYPYDMDNQLLSQFLLILNRLSGSADEMGGYVMLLKTELDQMEDSYNNQLDEKENLISELNHTIENLNIDLKEKKEITEKLNQLKKPTYGHINLENSNYKNLPYLPNLDSLKHIEAFQSYNTFQHNPLLSKIQNTLDISNKLGFSQTFNNDFKFNKPYTSDVLKWDFDKEKDI